MRALLACLVALCILSCMLANISCQSHVTRDYFLTVRLPLRIDSDSDFTAENGVTGGSGTESDPWLIEGWDIGGSGHGYCFYIGNTTDYFTVTKCRAHNASGVFVSYYYTESGIILYNVSGGNVSGNIAKDNEFDGICLYGTEGCQISDNNVSFNEYGITVMEHSDGNVISDNGVFSNNYYGINFLESDMNFAISNNVTANGGNGISVSESSANCLRNNTVSGNWNGIDIWDSDNISAEGNHVCGNCIGLYLEYCVNSTVSNNNASENTDYGIQLVSSDINRIFHNTLTANGLAQAKDGLGGNSWDDGYPSGGNLWGDYSGSDSDGDGFGDAPYLGILGDMGARDRYPLMQSWFDDAVLPTASAGPDVACDEDSTITLNGSGSNDNVGIVNCTWTFNNSFNEVFLFQRLSNYTFTQPGNYSIVLEVTDSAGNRASDGMVASVRDITPPTADAGADLGIGEMGTAFLNGSASADNVGIVNYTWNFNDGVENIALFGPEVSHIFTVSGLYSATLTAADSEGWQGTDTVLVTVSADSTPPEANAGPDICAAIGEAIRFNGSGSSDNVAIGNYTWSFTCNGSVCNLYGAEPSVTFWAAGNYTVTLSVRDMAGNIGTDETVVSVAAGSIQNGTVSSEENESGIFSSSVAVAGVLAMVSVLIILAFFIHIRKRVRPPL
ncbi:MAG: PKD domain-containing protein [Thermoplasmata archaeon]|nr:PKD domain-containing protein [Thermoplasmata archaeon]